MGEFFRRIYYLFHRRRLEQELQNDMAVHRELLGQEKQKDFGNRLLLEERAHEAWGWSWLDRFLQDLRYGFRMLRKSPGYTAVALLALGLGIGVNTALFSVVYGVLLKPLPYAQGQQLVVLRQQFTKENRDDDAGFSVKEIQDYRAQSRSLAQVEEYHGMGFVLLDGKEPERVRTGVVSAHFFDMLGIEPYLGRLFTDSDDTPGADAVLLLSYPYWKQHYSGDPKIIGRRFRMNDKVHTVVGVLPPVPQYPQENDVYMPTVACPYRSSDMMKADRNDRMMLLFGRLKPGETVQSGVADMSLIASRFQQAYPENYPVTRGFTSTLDSLHKKLTEDVRPLLLVLLGTAGLVLLIACANVANLALARMMRREQELAVRAAMGASRGRLVRQLLTESTLLSLGGGALGLWLASGCVGLLITFAGRFTTRAAEVTISLPVLLFTLTVSVLTGLAFGSIPAFSQRVDLVNSLKENSNAATEKSSRHRMRNLLAMAQVAISFMLLIGAGLMIRSFVRLQQVNGGYNGENVLSAVIPLTFNKYSSAGMKMNETAVKSFYTRVVQKLEGTPGIQGVALNSGAPLAPNGPQKIAFVIDDHPLTEGEKPETNIQVASPEAFQLLGVPLISGRFFTGQDNADAPPVVIVSRGLAKHYFPNGDPVDRRISFPEDDKKRHFKIVGVVGDVNQYGLDKNPVDTIYTAFEQMPDSASTLMVRTSGDPMNYVKQLRAAVYSVDPDQPITHIKTLDQLRGDTLAATRLTSLLLGLFAALALAIAATGLSGVTALLVSQRTREIGIRLALGAQRSQVMRMILLQGMRTIVIGLAIGLIGALLASRVMQTFMFKTTVTDPLTFAGVALVLFAVALVASYIPARRVTRVDPMIALRTE
ncbi:MAG TPA: ABC transporter permease [Candidatus Angelobacter sp.]